MRRLSLLLVVGATAAAPWSLSHAHTPVQILTAGCADDAKKFSPACHPGEAKSLPASSRTKIRCLISASRLLGRSRGVDHPRRADLPRSGDGKGPRS